MGSFFCRGFVVVVGLGALACASGSGSKKNPATGGESGEETGGAPGTSGAPGTGGRPIATGGAPGTGGRNATGGESGGSTGGAAGEERDASAPDGPPTTATGGASGAGGAVASCVLKKDPALGTSSWVYLDASGQLGYKALPQGDHIVDYSWAGYGGGGVALPSAAVKRMVMPSGGDDTAAIQAAIDAVAQLPAEGGVRGAVLLGPGNFQLAGATGLNLGASGVVLRGSGVGSTTVTITGTAHVLVQMRGTGSWQAMGTPVAITDAYVPAGARSFHVSDASGFKVGDPILVDRPVTAAWIALLGMDKLVRNGAPQTWLNPGSVVHSDRVILAIAGNQITIDAPLTDSLDAKYLNPPGATVVKYTFPGRIEQVGVESLKAVAPPPAGGGSLFVTMGAVKDAWVKDVAFTDFWNGIQVSSNSKQVTFQDLKIARTTGGATAAPADISVTGQQVLVQRASSVVLGDVHFLITGSLSPGPIVFRNFTATVGSRVDSAPHQRWTTGVLYERINTPGAGIELQNRGNYGSGQGWSAGWSVLWNCTAKEYLVQQPPGAQNWSIGCTGNQLTDTPPGGSQPGVQGAIDSPGKAVNPASLYLAQLCQRLGPAALANVGE